MFVSKIDIETLANLHSGAQIWNECIADSAMTIKCRKGVANEFLIINHISGDAYHLEGGKIRVESLEDIDDGV